MKQEKRVIESVGELVEVLSQGVHVVCETSTYMYDFDDLELEDIISFDFYKYAYLNPVEVVELYFNDNEESVNIEVEGVFKMYEAKENTDTHKQTQIIQDGKVIYTKTEKI